MGYALTAGESTGALVSSRTKYVQDVWQFLQAVVCLSEATHRVIAAPERRVRVSLVRGSPRPTDADTWVDWGQGATASLVRERQTATEAEPKGVTLSALGVRALGDEAFALRGTVTIRVKRRVLFSVRVALNPETLVRRKPHVFIDKARLTAQHET
jgi:hypothetical protein